ncbi:hypothetical protein IWW36_005253 [Coemansia brasiliensis]|uniref:RRM domain-containing protein n=1 Tax=Coemansia brasiliensis TaxID=2650707 RepID=A0A9W8LWU0_9FUNG|nr:hypothetical protein IWW36_005253 [Coemansia brasiliensis]
MEDVREECSTFGTVDDLVIPRSNPENPDEKVPGMGKIFVKFSSIAEATAALNALAGRQFSGRTVIASYITEDDFSNKNF